MWLLTVTLTNPNPEKGGMGFSWVYLITNFFSFSVFTGAIVVVLTQFKICYKSSSVMLYSLDYLYVLVYCYIYKKNKNKTLWPLFMDGVQLPQG